MVEVVEVVDDDRGGGAWRGYCVCGMAAAEEERTFEEAVEMVLEGAEAEPLWAGTDFAGRRKGWGSCWCRMEEGWAG